MPKVRVLGERYAHRTYHGDIPVLEEDGVVCLSGVSYGGISNKISWTGVAYRHFERRYSVFNPLAPV